jgi:hypothetical protein
VSSQKSCFLRKNPSHESHPSQSARTNTIDRQGNEGLAQSRRDAKFSNGAASENPKIRKSENPSSFASLRDLRALAVNPSSLRCSMLGVRCSMFKSPLLCSLCPLWLKILPSETPAFDDEIHWLSMDFTAECGRFCRVWNNFYLVV